MTSAFRIWTNSPNNFSIFSKYQGDHRNYKDSEDPVLLALARIRYCCRDQQDWAALVLLMLYHQKANKNGSD